MLTQKASRFDNAVGHNVAYRMQRVVPPARLTSVGPTIKTFPANALIFQEGECTDYVYKLERGAVRSYKMLANGRRTIDAFALPGDIFGIDPTKAREFTAEAIDDVAVVIVQRNILVEKGTTDYEALREVWIATAWELRRVQQHAILLGKTGQQRLASFLLEMSRRLRQTDILELPMPRQDIADYLGLTIETVCRMISRLQSQRVIEANSRQIVLCDLDALQCLNEGA
jgi:CRP/FNR family nitrogen fixation transcriptional regulator